MGEPFLDKVLPSFAMLVLQAMYLAVTHQKL